MSDGGNVGHEGKQSHIYKDLCHVWKPICVVSNLFVGGRGGDDSLIVEARMLPMLEVVIVVGSAG